MIYYGIDATLTKLSGTSDHKARLLNKPARLLLLLRKDLFTRHLEIFVSRIWHRNLDFLAASAFPPPSIAARSSRRTPTTGKHPRHVRQEGRDRPPFSGGQGGDMKRIAKCGGIRGGRV